MIEFTRGTCHKNLSTLHLYPGTTRKDALNHPKLNYYLHVLLDIRGKKRNSCTDGTIAEKEHALGEI